MEYIVHHGKGSEEHLHQEKGIVSDWAVKFGYPNRLLTFIVSLYTNVRFVVPKMGYTV